MGWGVLVCVNFFTGDDGKAKQVASDEIKGERGGQGGVAENRSDLSG